MLLRESSCGIIKNKYIGFPGGSDDKDSACNAEDPGLIPGLGRFPGGGNGKPLQYSYLGKSHGQKNLAGYSPWGCKESDTTKQINHVFPVSDPQLLKPLESLT